MAGTSICGSSLVPRLEFDELGALLVGQTQLQEASAIATAVEEGGWVGGGNVSEFLKIELASAREPLIFPPQSGSALPPPPF